mgnify:CR=1 FL=1
MTYSGEWKISEWRELDAGDDLEGVFAKSWNRKAHDSVESWAIVGNPHKSNSDELLYQVLYGETPISISAKDILLNLSEVNISFKDGLSIMVPNQTNVHFTEEDIITSFEDKESAEEYVEERI